MLYTKIGIVENRISSFKLILLFIKKLKYSLKELDLPMDAVFIKTMILKPTEIEIFINRLETDDAQAGSKRCEI